MSELRISLSDGWRLALVPDAAVTGGPVSFAQAEALGGVTVPARVPGDFALDLQRAGLLDEPFYSDRFAGLMKYETYHVFYGAEFTADAPGGADDVFLFEGIDTVADVYLNGESLGHAENMFIPHEFPASAVRAGKNELFVHIFPAALEARKYETGAMEQGLRYNAESLVLRKAAHSFGWDIAPRIVSAGLWRPVSLVRKKPVRIDDVFLYAKQLNGDGSLDCAAAFRVSAAREDIGRYSVKLRGVCGGSVFETEQRLWFVSGCLKFTVKDPMLWWPRGCGDPNRYDVTFTLYRDGAEADSVSFRQGLRTAALDRTDTLSPEGDGKFCFVVNGKRIFVKGTNWVPADAFHSRDAERIPKILDLVWDVGCNALRCWGGGVYESDEFYEWCCAHGILVWQDFMMACAVYPQDGRMKESLRGEVRAVVKRLRRFECICLWAGDNECDVCWGNWNVPAVNPAYNALTRQVIPGVLNSEDTSRPYLPSSPYVSAASFAAGKALKTPEQHLWGPRGYFKAPFYHDANAVFASEIGYHGCPSPESVKKFLPPEQLWPHENNSGWILHAASPEVSGGTYAYRIPLMAKQIACLFAQEPRSLAEFAQMSQAVQAEAFKYFIESFRARKWERTGLIWWNIMDCWPQFSDAVVDYYGCRKLAYRFIRRSQAEVCLMMDDRGGRLRLWGVNDGQKPVSLRYRAGEIGGGNAVFTGEAVLEADSSLALASVPDDGAQRFWLITWESEAGSGRNHYLAGRPAFDFPWYLECLEQAGMKEYEGF